MQRIGLIEETKPVTVEVAPEGTASENGTNSSEGTTVEDDTVEVAPEGKKKSKK